MHYPAIVTTEGQHTLAEFPDCPGCQTFASPGQDIVARAQEAIEGWLEVHLEDGQAPPRPSKRVRAPHGASVIEVPVAPKLGVALSIRWLRHDLGLNQKEFAARMGVSQQQAAKLEDPESNPTIETLAKVARAFGADIEVALVLQH